MHVPPTSLIPSGWHSADRPTRSQRKPETQSPSLLQGAPAAPVPEAAQVRSGPQYDPLLHSSLMVHDVPVPVHPQASHLPLLHVRPDRQASAVPHDSPTPAPAGWPESRPPSSKVYSPEPISHAPAATKT